MILKILVSVFLVEMIIIVPFTVVMILRLFSQKDTILKNSVDLIVPKFIKKLSKVIKKEVKENVDEHFNRNLRVETDVENMDFLNS